MSTIDSGSASGICIVYDALDRVVEQNTGTQCNTSPTSSTQIVYGPSGDKLALMNGATLVKAFVSLIGGAKGVYNSAGLQYYRHADWLGSSRLASTPTRTLYYSGAYAPFGENYAASGTQDLSFTGQNQDTLASGAGGAGGMYDFLYRKQSPVQGRWLSPDPSGRAAADASDPQSWNRYAYVGNRPLQTTDPTGLWFVGPCNPFEPGGPIGPGCPCDPFYDIGCGGGCDPFFYPFCGPPPFPPPIPPGFPGGLGIPRPPTRRGGVWPGNETLGLPSGLNLSPLTLDNLLGFLPGLGCFGQVVGGFLDSSAPKRTSSCLPKATAFAAAALFNHWWGWETEVALCVTTTFTPVYAHCEYSCETGEPGVVGHANFGIGELTAACGPLSAPIRCPRHITIEARTFWVLGVGVASKTKITSCMP